MWGSSEEPPGTMEAGPPESVANLKETCEQNKNQLEAVKDIMLRNKQSLKKKEEELQEYAKKLSKFKTRKASRPKDEAMSSNESTPKSKSDASTAEPSDDVVDDISQAKTPKAKSSLLQKKLAEDRKIFEQRSKELSESKRAVEEKVEALRQQLEEKYVAPVSVVSPVIITSQVPHPLLEISHVQDKDNKIAELSNKILELEALVIDLQDNLKEKDSVIDSKTKAITLMSADLSMKGKTTLDTLEDTKDEMRSMQENFILVETSLRDKNDNLLKQLEEKTDLITRLEESVQSLSDKLEAQKEADSANADLSRSTMDTLVDTKDAMKSMQENFVLIESSLKTKNDHLLKQLEEREIKLAEAEARILSLESGIGIERQPNVEDLLYKVEKLEKTNHELQDEKYELQKSIAELQERIIASQNNEQNNRITELEALIEQLKQSSASLDESHKNELQSYNEKNEEMSNKLTDLEKMVQDLEHEKMELVTKMTASEAETPKEDERVAKLTQELDDLNKSMIKLKAQHKNKLKNLQKQLENFKKVSDTNAELVKLGNQVAILEEEKGNLQLSLVDFDELKASAAELKERINDLEGKVTAQAKEIQTHIEAIAILENQKLDLMQELHAVKQEVSSLEAENAESENLRVTAEMKVVDLEEELESLHKIHAEPLTDSERSELQHEIEHLSHENERLSQKISKLEELKSSSEVGSTESFVKTGSNVDSTESFEALAADADKVDLLKKIDGLTRENAGLLEKLSRFEEKGSSDTGSTESFERIQPEQNDQTVKLENLTKENQDLVIKLTKLEEKLESSVEAESRLELLIQENERLIGELSQLQEKLAQTEEIREKRSIEETTSTEAELSSFTPVKDEADIANVNELLIKIESLTAENGNLTARLQELEEKQTIAQQLQAEHAVVPEVTQVLAEESVMISEETHTVENPAARSQGEVTAERETIASLESEIERCNALINDQKNVIEDMKTKLAEKEEELERKLSQITSEDSELNESLRRELAESSNAIAEWQQKFADMEEKMEQLERSKQNIEEGFQALHNENRNLIEQSEHKDAMVISLKEELENTISSFEKKVKEQSDTIGSQEELVNELRKDVECKNQELQAKYTQLQNDLIKIDELQDHVNKLEGQVHQKDATIASLTEEVENLRTNASVVEEDLFSARHQLTDLHEKLERSKSIEEYNELLDKLNDREMLVEELEAKVSQKIVEINSMKTQTELLVSENEQLRGQLQEEERKVTELLQELMDSNHNQEEELKNAERAKAEVENRLMELQTARDENLQHAKHVSHELQESYRMMELHKHKHDEDIMMMNQRLENLIEELQAKTQEVSSLQSELEDKNSAIDKCISEEVKSNLEVHVAELEKKLSGAEEKLHTQLEKMKKFAAVAKKKTAQCEELESKLKELEENLNSEKSEKEARNRELQESLTNLKEKDNRIADMEEELQQLKNERDEAFSNVDAVKLELNEAQSQLHILNEEVKLLHEAKDQARELGVRMQVMETEYMDQMAQINSLKTENGMLLSKQAQIMERFENVEKESEERRALIEKLEKEKEISETQRAEQQVTCGECTTRVRELESKIQERDAEIENLDNELHNSLGNLVEMQENLRLSTINVVQGAAVQESYNELMIQFNMLTTANEETKAKLEATIKENEELSETIIRLKELNATMQERIESVERELSNNKESVSSFENVNALYADLVDKFEKQKNELEKTHTELQRAIASHEASQIELLAKIEHLENDKQQLIKELDSLKNVNANAWELEATSPIIDVEAQFSQLPVVETMERQKREVDETVQIKEDSPPLFDSSVFGGAVTQTANVDHEREIEGLKQQVNTLNSQLEEKQTLLNALQESIESLTVSKSQLEEILTKKDAEIMFSKTELERTQQQIVYENREIDDFFSKAIFNYQPGPRLAKLSELGQQIVSMTREIDALRADKEQLTATEEVYKKRLTDMQNELSVNNDGARIVDLENRIARIVSEKDLLQLQLNDVNRAFEDYKESTAGLARIQEVLHAVERERDQLQSELEALKQVQALSVKVAALPIEETPSAPMEGVLTDPEGKPEDSMWEDDEDPWGFNDKFKSPEEPHVDIPVTLRPEVTMAIKVDELEEKLEDLRQENAKLVEDSRLAQLKNVKYVKKLKEYKLQFDNLQRQLKTQSSIGGFGDLDSAIEEELKSQVANLEKALSEAKEDTKKIIAEKEKLLKRIDVLTAATERFTEAKEKQDTEVHIWQMRYKELELKLQQFDFGPETKETSSSMSQEIVDPDVAAKYEEEIKELKENVEALAAENEELQQLLEEHRTKRQTSIDESVFNELQSKNVELIASNDKLKGDYDTLRKQYEQSLMDANDQVQNMRENCEILKNELIEKNSESGKTAADLNERLHAVLEEKAELETALEKLHSTATSLDEVSELLNSRVQEVAALKEELQHVQSENLGIKNELEESLTERESLTAAIQEKEMEIDKKSAELEELRGLVEKVKGLELSIEGYTVEVEEKNEEIHSLREKIAQYESILTEKEHQVNIQQSQLQQSTSEIQQCTSQVLNQEDLNQRLTQAHNQITELSAIVIEKDSQLHHTNAELEDTRHKLENAAQEIQSTHNELEETRNNVDAIVQQNQNLQLELEDTRKKLEVATEELHSLQTELNDTKNKLDSATQQLHRVQSELEDTKKRFEINVQEQSMNIQKEVSGTQESVKFVEDDIPVFTFGSDNNDQELQRLKEQLRAKDEEIEHLTYSVNEGAMTKIIQELQDNVNFLYNEKSELEGQLIAKNMEIENLRKSTSEPHDDHERAKRSENEQLIKLENELYEREQELNQLKHMLNEKDEQIRVTLDQASNNYDQLQTVDTMRNELYEKQQELENLKFTVSELQKEIASLRGLERLAADDRAAIDRLNSEKDGVRMEAEEAIQRVLKEKELEMDQLKQQLASENQNLMEALGLRERDIENLKLQIEQTGFDQGSLLEQKTEQLARLEAELSERDRRLAELSITKDTEIHNLRVQLAEKSARLEELIAMSEEEERQLAELRKLVDVKEQQIYGITQQLEEKSKEYELMQHALQRHVTKSDQSPDIQQQLQQSSSSILDDPSGQANELDVALYMLHQRDVRCEELTLELMQLLEERDTLQLRLSDAIRINEEFKKLSTTSSSSPQKDDSNSNAELLIEDPSPSKSEGPVEIAKEAIDSPIGDAKKALAQKLSQLKSVHHTKDVRLRDDRELRHTQQMSLLAHKDALNTLPPEAAARLVNANYTLSRDVQSQSSVLMNWLWGKSTPKVVHM